MVEVYTEKEAMWQELFILFFYSGVYSFLDLTLIYFGWSMFSGFIFVVVLVYSICHDLFDMPEIFTVQIQRARNKVNKWSLIVIFILLCMSAALSSDFKLEERQLQVSNNRADEPGYIRLNIPRLVYVGFPEPVQGVDYKPDFSRGNIAFHSVIDFVKINIFRLLISEAELAVLLVQKFYHNL